MDIFEEDILRIICGKGLIPPGGMVIAGISGGADSTALLRVLAALRGPLGLRLQAVHVEHGLRGKRALEDASFVEHLCRELDVPCAVEHVQVKELARREGRSVEEAGRMARYAVFEHWRKALDADRIAVAHHAQDQAETVLLNLVRGSGVRGLGGMRMCSSALVRPLLEKTREEIEAYLRRVGQDWHIDETNTDVRYARNRIRQNVLPQLELVHAGSVQQICRAASLLQRAEDYLARTARRALEAVLEQENADGLVLNRNRLLEEEPLVREYVLREALRRFLGGNGLKDFGTVHIEAMEQLLAAPSGKQVDLPGSVSARVEGAEYWLFKKNGKAGEETAPQTKGKALYVELPREELARGVRVLVRGLYGCPWEMAAVCAEYAEAPMPVPQKEYTKWLSYDTMLGSLCLRTRRPGDYLVIHETGGRKKLQDLLVNEKVPAAERDRVLLLAQGSHVLWAVGLRISAAAKVHPNDNRDAAAGTRKVVCIHLEPWQEKEEGDSDGREYQGVDCGRDSAETDWRTGGADQPGLSGTDIASDLHSEGEPVFYL